MITFLFVIHEHVTKCLHYDANMLYRFQMFDKDFVTTMVSFRFVIFELVAHDSTPPLRRNILKKSFDHITRSLGNNYGHRSIDR